MIQKSKSIIFQNALVYLNSLLCQFICVIIQLVVEEEGKSIQVASQSRLDAMIPTRLDGGIIVLKKVFKWVFVYFA